MMMMMNIHYKEGNRKYGEKKYSMTFLFFGKQRWGKNEIKMMK